MEKDPTEPAVNSTYPERSDPGSDPAAGVMQYAANAPRWAPVLARACLVVVLTGFYAVTFLHMWSVSKNYADLALGALYMAALLGLQVFYISRPTRVPQPPTSYLALLAQACLVYLPMLQFTDSWVGMPGFLAGSVLLLLPFPLAWVAFAAIVASMAVTQQFFFGGAPLDVAYITISTVITGLIVYGLTRLASLVTELHQARSDLAQMAVAQERLRFSRDLHDLLGYSLSAITLKSELTHRLVVKYPAKAQDELAEVLDISRRALADVRAVASGYRELSLDAEARSARSVLTAADVDVQMDLRYGELPVQIRTLLATVLREGVTNVLRHSKAEMCDIAIRQDDEGVWMKIVNDGVPEAPEEPAPYGGSGIHNLSVRVKALGGTLTAGVDPDNRYTLHVTAPLARRG